MNGLSHALLLLDVLQDEIMNDQCTSEVGSGDQLDFQVLSLLKHLLGLVLPAKDLQVGVHNVVVLLSQLLVFLFELADHGSLWFNLVHHVDQVIELSIKLTVGQFVAIDSLKGVVVKSICANHLNDSQLSSHLLDLVLLEMDFNLLVRKLHEHIVEHDLLHAAISRKVKSYNLPISELLAACDPLFEWNESPCFLRVSLCQVNEEVA